MADTFKLHSNPSATKVIYLDFDGHVTSKTAWQSGATINTPAYSLDSNVSAFSDAEKLAIQRVWARVVEDFIPFDVNVTTEQPALEDLRKSGASDTRWGMRVVIGGDGAWMSGAAGVAFLDSFNWDSDTPCFVFAGQSWKTNENFMATCISHEVGHTLGLRHDGYNGAEYYGGRGTGETSWGPLMGNPGSRNLTQWSKGEYGGSTNKEDDLTIITTKNGFGYRPDDHGNTIQTATVGGTGTWTSQGIVGSTSDVDVFQFTTGGSIAATINPISVGTNLDILATLLDSKGTVIATSNPLDKVAASFTTTVTAGTYYLSVRGTGMGDINTTGYTAYGSLGQYTVSLEGSQPPPPSGTPTISISDLKLVEGNSGNTSGFVTVKLSQASSQTVTVKWASRDGTATVADGDYSFPKATGGTATFAPGQTSVQIDVVVTGDAKVEPNETFDIVLSSPAGATLAKAVGTVTITNDDSAPPPAAVAVSVNDIVLVEGNSGPTVAEFTVSLSEASRAPVAVWYSTVDGTATLADRDYVASKGTVTFLPGETQKTVRVSVTGDTRPEAAESFGLVLSSPSNAKLAKARGTATISNDDSANILVSIADAAVREGNAGTRVISFVVSLSAPARDPVSVKVRTADGTALAGSDYTAETAKPVVFARGMTKQTVTIWVAADTAFEADETFTLELFDAVGAAIDRGTARGTIVNDDAIAAIQPTHLALWAQLGQAEPSRGGRPTAVRPR